MTTPIVEKKSDNEYRISNAQKTGVKQYAILKKVNDSYTVETIINAPLQTLNLNELGVVKNNKYNYWLVAIGKQNQLSKLVALP
jgi:flavoprotein